MNIDIIYPILEKKKINKYKFIKTTGYLFIISLIICVLINIMIKGKPWSLLVAISVYMAWTFILSPTLIEYNRLDQFVKLLTVSCFMLHMIDIFFSRGFAIKVIPIVLFSGILFSSILLFTDYEKQKKNIFSVFLLLVFSFVISLIAIISKKVEIKWVYHVLFYISIFYLFICLFIVKNNIFKEFKKRFSIK